MRSARRAGFKLRVAPHTIGEALLVLQRKGSEGTCRSYRSFEKLPRIYPALEFKGYDKSEFMRFFSALLAAQVARDGPLLASDLAEGIGRVGVADFLVTLAAFADPESKGLITIDKDLLRGVVVSQLNEIYGYGEGEKSVSPAPHRVFADCQVYLEHA